MTNRCHSQRSRTFAHELVIGCILALVVLMAFSSAALAQGPAPTYKGPDQCAACHSAEARAWQNSTHAKATSAVPPDADRACLRCHTTAFDASEGTCAYKDVECEACHGPYVEGHPRSTVMKLPADSSACQECHAKTYEQWQATPHAALNVQCIGCHDAHSQSLRLPADQLCTSCHRAKLDSFPHSEHNSLGIECTVCHVPLNHSGQAGVVLASTGGGNAPNHTFTPPAEACVGCHAQGTVPMTAGETQPDPAKVLADQLEAAERENTSLRNLAIVTLGVGLGIGGVLGVVAILLIGYIAQRRGKPWTI
ncbi:MAG: hypothetical protein Kow00123_12720 [Anaerolineales bacterium]